MIPARAGSAAGTNVTNLGRAPHLAGHQHEGLVQQAARGQVLQKSGEGAVKLRQQVLAQAVEVVAVRVPSTRALALLGGAFILLPKHGHKRHPRLDHAPCHQEAHAIDVLAIALAKFDRLRGNVESAGGGIGGQELERPLVLLEIVLHLRISLKPALRVVERGQQGLAIRHPRGAHRAGHGDARRAEFQRLVKVADQEERIVLDADAPGKLPGPREGQLARFVRQSDELRQARVHGPLHGHHAAHVRPVLAVRTPVIALLLEGGIRRVTRQVVVVARVVIARRPP